MPGTFTDSLTVDIRKTLQNTISPTISRISAASAANRSPARVAQDRANETDPNRKKEA
jgi:hypothetical protein